MSYTDVVSSRLPDLLWRESHFYDQNIFAKLAKIIDRFSQALEGPFFLKFNEKQQKHEIAGCSSNLLRKVSKISCDGKGLRFFFLRRGSGSYRSSLN